MAVGSIVDYLNSTGGDSSYAARKKLAQQYGIQDYKGSAEQNTRLLNQLQNGGATAAASSGGSAQKGPTANVLAGTGVQTAGSTPGNGTGPGEVNAVASASGTGQSTVKRGYTPTQSVLDAYSEMKKYQGKKPSYSESDATSEYRDKLQSLESSKPGEFQSQFSDKIDALIDSIYNDKGFSYGAEELQADPLYKMYAQQYQQSAQRAMRDTMGAAAGMTGGYGSTYAQAAGQQAYDQTMIGLNDKVLDFWDRAYKNYRDDQANRYNQLGALQSQDNIDYSRYRDNVSDWLADRSYYAGRYDSERSFDYGMYRDDMSDYMNDRTYYAGRYDSALGADMDMYQSDLSKEQWEKEYEMNKAAQELENQLTQLQIQREQWEFAQAQQAAAAAAATSSGGSSGGSGGRKKSSSKKSISSKTAAKKNEKEELSAADYKTLANDIYKSELGNAYIAQLEGEKYNPTAKLQALVTAGKEMDKYKINHALR